MSAAEREAELAAELASMLAESGLALLRGAFVHPSLYRLKDAAARCFAAVETDRSLAERLGFNRFSHSVPVTALTDFGCDREELTAPLSTPGLAACFSEIMGGDWSCNLEQSWVRKKFASAHAPGREYHLQGWHQDGALGVQFPQESELAPPMTRLLTCWIPLQACGIDSPGLEFLRRPQPALLHFTELDDAALRRRFPSRDFWAPELVLGDGLIFLNSVLHRTYANEQMLHDRLSVEYRIFPR
jgi:hypothetical protein